MMKLNYTVDVPEYEITRTNSRHHHQEKLFASLIAQEDEIVKSVLREKLLGEFDIVEFIKLGRVTSTRNIHGSATFYLDGVEIVKFGEVVIEFENKINRTTIYASQKWWKP